MGWEMWVDVLAIDLFLDTPLFECFPTDWERRWFVLSILESCDLKVIDTI